MAATTMRLLARVLDEPDLVPAVRALDPAHLHALVREVGLEDAGELLAMATTEQFTHLVDESLWTQDECEESFDHQRCPIWLEVMFESGEAFVVERLRALPEDTLVLAFAGQLFVVDNETFGAGMAGASAHEAELAAKVLDASLYLELHRYTLVARHDVGWDVVIAALLALDTNDPELVERILKGCRGATTDTMGVDGDLYSAVLRDQQVLEENAHAERQQRRGAQGYVDPRDAEAFMRLACHAPKDGVPGRDPVTRAYFRELAARPAADVLPTPSPLAPLLRELGIEPPGGPALPSIGPMRLRAALATLPHDTALARVQELVYLANVLVACGRGYSPLAAAQEVVRVCTLGVRHFARDDEEHQATIIADVEFDRLFQVGLALEVGRDRDVVSHHR